MDIWQYIFLFFAIILAFPAGSFIAKLTKEELKSGRKWFRAIIGAAIAVIILSFCLRLCFEDKLIIIASMLFVIIVAAISYYKSMPKRRVVESIRKKKAVEKIKKREK